MGGKWKENAPIDRRAAGSQSAIGTYRRRMMRGRTLQLQVRRCAECRQPGLHGGLYYIRSMSHDVQHRNRRATNLVSL